jgi:hypothetical protein
MSRLRLGLYAIAVVVISGVVSLGVFTLISSSTELSPRITAQAATEEPRYWSASSVQEAAGIAGYTLAEPGFLPVGFVPTSQIHIIQPKAPRPDSPRLPKYVTRSWTWEKDPSVGFLLTQDPKMSGLGGGTATTINGVPGQQRLQGPNPPAMRHSFLNLFWRDGQFGYLLEATLSGPLTEDVVRQIAASVKVP